VTAFDPEAADTTRRIFSDRIAYADSPEAAIDGADALAVLTEWNTFRRPDFDEVKRLLAAPVVFDGRNLYDPAFMHQQGFDYHSVGRPFSAD
jgi:UDPglucose 6-dehydrogenase